MCGVDKKYKIAGKAILIYHRSNFLMLDKIDWDKPADPPSKTVIPFSTGGSSSKPDKPNKQNPFKPFKPVILY